LIVFCPSILAGRHLAHIWGRLKPPLATFTPALCPDFREKAANRSCNFRTSPASGPHVISAYADLAPTVDRLGLSAANQPIFAGPYTNRKRCSGSARAEPTA
jgi:hypothetical protein